MNSPKTLRYFTYLFTLLSAPSWTFSHGQSEEMLRALNAPTPDWMSIGEPIKVTPIVPNDWKPVNAQPEEKGSSKTIEYRPLSGDCSFSLTSVYIPAFSPTRPYIPERDLKITPDHGVTDASLSSDGKRLIINSGPAHLYEILDNGKFRKLELQLPDVTYDPGLKGIMHGWSWAGDDVVLGFGEVLDETGHHALDTRLYAFHLKEKVLSRLDLSELGLAPDAYPKVSGVATDQKHIKIEVSDREIEVKVDLKSPPKVSKAPAPATPTESPKPAEQDAQDGGAQGRGAGKP